MLLVNLKSGVRNIIGGRGRDLEHYLNIWTFLIVNILNFEHFAYSLLGDFWTFWTCAYLIYHLNIYWLYIYVNSVVLKKHSIMIFEVKRYEQTVNFIEHRLYILIMLLVNEGIFECACRTDSIFVILFIREKSENL